MKKSSGYISFKKLFLLALPFLLWQFLELFVLPENSFTFRAWETLGVTELHLPGPFYPNQDLNMFTAGDQDAARRPIKWVRFITDRFGFRNRPENETESYDVVVIGDSNIAGSHIDQKDTLSEVLARKCNCSVYNHAYGLPRNILSFFNDPRFKQNPPKHVVFEMRRGDVSTKVLEDIPSCQVPYAKLSRTWDAYACRDYSWRDVLVSLLPISLQIKADRLYKQPFFHFLKSRLGIASRPSFENAKSTDTEREELINHSVRTIVSYADEAKRRGTHFIFLYFPYFQREFDSLITRLEEAGVDTIGFLPDKKHTWSVEDYRSWMHKEDSHWLESSIIESADLILEKLRNFEKSAARHEYSSLRSSFQSGHRN